MFEQIQKALAERVTGDAALAAWREASLAGALAQGLPGPRDEAWRYAPIRGMERLSWVPAAPSQPTADSASLAELLPPALPGFARMVIVNGIVDAALSSSAPARAPAAVVDGLRGLDALANGDAARSLANNSFALLGRLLTGHPLQLVLDARAESRVHLVFVTTAAGRDGPSPTTLRITVAAGCRAEIVEEHVAGKGVAAFANHVVDTAIDSGSELLWTRLLVSAVDARHLETVRLQQAENSKASLLQVAPGNAGLRSTVVATLDGAGAQLQFNSVALGEGNQQLDQHVLIDHRGVGVKSTEVFRGLAAGRARVAFTGHNRVMPTALNTDTRQSLRSLIAGREAEAVARPQLEILTDAVQASHGATVGTLDPQMLFYLLSRGLEPAAAQSLLKWAFLQDVISHLQPAGLRTRLEAQLLARLGDPLLTELAP
jgi:Fe-S cluster assembly protein SufD